METSTRSAADVLSDLLMHDEPARALWVAIDSGLMDELVPELSDLRMEQDPIHRHKDVLSHTVAVAANAGPDLVVRLACLFHDIGKPRTRAFQDGNVTFRHHEAVGAKITRRRLRALGYSEDIVRDVTELVRLSGRFKGYASGWSDSAVRRYARDAGHLLGRLNHLVRSDCTTRNRAKAEELQSHVDDLERRIKALAETDRRAAERPGLDGADVMEHLGIGPGPAVGRALAFLLEVKRAEGDLPPDELRNRLDEWWAAEGDEAGRPGSS